MDEGGGGREGGKRGEEGVGGRGRERRGGGRGEEGGNTGKKEKMKRKKNGGHDITIHFDIHTVYVCQPWIRLIQRCCLPVCDSADGVDGRLRSNKAGAKLSSVVTKRVHFVMSRHVQTPVPLSN